jgi:hypothetical protein
MLSPPKTQLSRGVHPLRRPEEGRRLFSLSVRFIRLHVDVATLPWWCWRYVWVWRGSRTHPVMRYGRVSLPPSLPFCHASAPGFRSELLGALHPLTPPRCPWVRSTDLAAAYMNQMHPDKNWFGVERETPTGETCAPHSEQKIRPGWAQLDAVESYRRAYTTYPLFVHCRLV